MASRTARATEDLRADGRSEVRVSVSGLGSGMMKPAGTVTFGVFLVLVVVEGMVLNRSSKNPMCKALDDTDDCKLGRCRRDGWGEKLVASENMDSQTKIFILE